MSVHDADTVDILAIAAHRDDVEQTCGGTLLKMAQHGHRTGILDLTRGEMGTRGTAGQRASEAEEAARLLRVCWRQALDIPDGNVENTYENRLKVAKIIRQLRPRVVILPYWAARHPDHYTSAPLGYEACFLAGLSRLDSQSKPHRPFKIVYASLYHDVRPTFVVDIGAQFETRFQSLMAYRSQYSDQAEGAGLFVPNSEIYDRIATMAKYHGMLAGVSYAEPFVHKEVGLVDDLTLLPVQSI